MLLQLLTDPSCLKCLQKFFSVEQPTITFEFTFVVNHITMKLHSSGNGNKLLDLNIFMPLGFRTVRTRIVQTMPRAEKAIKAKLSATKPKMCPVLS